MATFLISYDLLKPGQSYDTLIQALQRAGAKKVLYSTWVVKTTWNANQVRDWVVKLVDTNDRVVVTEVNTNWASYNALVRRLDQI